MGGVQNMYMETQIAWNCIVGKVNIATVRQAFCQVGGRRSDTM